MQGPDARERDASIPMSLVSEPRELSRLRKFCALEAGGLSRKCASSSKSPGLGRNSLVAPQLLKPIEQQLASKAPKIRFAATTTKTTDVGQTHEKISQTNCISEHHGRPARGKRERDGPGPAREF